MLRLGWGCGANGAWSLSPLPPAPSSSPAEMEVFFSHHRHKHWGRVYKETQTYGVPEGLQQLMAIRKEGRSCKDWSPVGLSGTSPMSRKLLAPCCLPPLWG